MKVLVIGSGGREHAIVYSLKKSALVDRLFCTPGNAGTVELAENPGLAADDFDSLLHFVKNEKIDLTVVGPEAPLVQGISDLFAGHGLSVFGPSSEGALIEGSKIFSKELMKKSRIPTADFSEFYDRFSAAKYIKSKKPPYVIKADGLAGGKGVIITKSADESEEVLSAMFEKKIFGESGTKVVIEEFLEGEEATVLALCDGKNVVPLISSQDHKPVYDGDKGPNTGGMGAIAPAPVVNERVMDRVMDRILNPLVHELNRRNIVYRGIIYAGLMISDENPSVVEFNCRFGDPEAEAVLPLLDSDLCDLIFRAVNGELKDVDIKWKHGFSCDVVLVSGGYPGKYEKGKEISGLEKHVDDNEMVVFHSGTKVMGGRTVSNGGRVLNIVGLGKTLKTAMDRAYRLVNDINFENMFYRRDIGFRGLKYFS
ncbi:MAG: phosphoribosylamine--glycine ligase [Spirochaetes bacterium]|nr:phosphoribosylamine--glycine ligase [Spirochaetota bacterium]